jgi:hypothetical protein
MKQAITRHATTTLTPALRRSAIVALGAGLILATVEFLGCDQVPPVDVHFDSSVGADWAPPAAPDAGPDSGSAAATGAP